MGGIKFKPISNKTRREIRETMREQGLLDFDPRAEEFDIMAVEAQITRCIMPFVASWDFKSVDTGEPIPPNDLDAYEVMSPTQTQQLFEAFGEATNGKSTVPPKSGGR